MQRKDVFCAAVPERISVERGKGVLVHRTDGPSMACRIKRADRRLTPKAVACERHFESGYIERYFQITVNGVVNEIARDKARLKPDAVPTVCEDYPTHLVPKKAVKLEGAKHLRPRTGT
ncbi:hypothetical protein MTO96_027554 [Rhipicephalus appendiculatus]